MTGIIQCPCGSDIFEVWESNERQIVTLGCRQCGTEIRVYDSGRYGWVKGFDCIRIGIPCVNCSFKDREWVDTETM